jgi:pyruvate formate lyase activating enzyme
MKGLVFSVKKYSVHDGPGIRVTFFLKGCPLRCRWCHNPEGISKYPQNIRQDRKIGEKEFFYEEVAGKYYTVDDVLSILEKERVFIEKSMGGVTFSGGEPMMQRGFLLECLKACRKNGYHTTIDTSGYASEEDFLSVIPFTDLFLFDIKHLDNIKHQELTGAPNSTILSNLNLILKHKCNVIIRFPVIPGCNDDIVHLKKLRQFLSGSESFKPEKLCLLPFHKTGASKYRRMGIPYTMEDTEQPSKLRMTELKEFFVETGLKVRIGG